MIPDEEGISTVEGDLPRRMKIVSPKKLGEYDLRALHGLLGGQQAEFNEVFMRAEVTDKRIQQLIVAGDVPNIMTDTPATIRKVVGWMRGSLWRTTSEERPYWSVDRVFTDITVDRHAVTDRLMHYLKERIAHRKTVEGVRIIVPPSNTEATTHYLQEGFRELTDDISGALVWKPGYRRY